MENCEHLSQACASCIVGRAVESAMAEWPSSEVSRGRFYTEVAKELILLAEGLLY